MVGSVLVTLSVMVGIYGIVTASSVGWGSSHTLGILGARRRTLRRLHHPRVAAGQPDHAAAHPEAAYVDRLERNPGLHHHRHVLDVLHRRALFRARPGYSPVKTGVAFLPRQWSWRLCRPA